MTRMLDIQDLTFHAGNRAILEGITLRVSTGECIAIVGPNGGGKSTLIKAMIGLVAPTEGRVTWAGTDVRRMSGRDRAAALAWLPQHGLILEAIPVLEFVKAARFRFDEGRRASLDAAREALGAVDADGLASQSISTLSGGEFQRVMMATLIAQDAEIFLLDEPANHLDPAHQFALFERIATQWRDGRGVVCITHDINLLTHLAPLERAKEVRVVGLAEGRIRFDNRLDDPGLGTALGALFGMDIATVERNGRRYFLTGAAP